MSVFVDENSIAVYAKPSVTPKLKVTLAFGDEIKLLDQKKNRFRRSS